MRQYLLRNKQPVPRFMVVAVASWAIALAAMTAFGFAVWILTSWVHVNALSALPKPLLLLVGICGAYAGLGSVCLWVSMWVYWVAVERSSTAARVGWFLVLLFGLHYGALVYAYRVWRTGINKVDQPVRLTDSHAIGSPKSV
jgi:hypothetical protein